MKKATCLVDWPTTGPFTYFIGQNILQLLLIVDSMGYDHRKVSYSNVNVSAYWKRIHALRIWVLKYFEHIHIQVYGIAHTASQYTDTYIS